MPAFAKSAATLVAITLATYAIAPTAHAASLLEWSTLGNSGNETTQPDSFVAANLTPASLVLGPGVTAAGNTNRFGGSNWYDTGDSANQTLAQAIAGNDYIEFTVTPDAGYNFTATGFNFIWDRSTTGPDDVTLRSSADGFAADLATATGLTATTATFTNLSFSLTSGVATTFRLYGYDGTTVSGTAGFDTSTKTPNVLLLGSTQPIGAIATPLPAAFLPALSLLGFVGFAAGIQRRRRFAFAR